MLSERYLYCFLGWWRLNFFVWYRYWRVPGKSRYRLIRETWWKKEAVKVVGLWVLESTRLFVAEEMGECNGSQYMNSISMANSFWYFGSWSASGICSYRSLFEDLLHDRRLRLIPELGSSEEGFVMSKMLPLYVCLLYHYMSSNHFPHMSITDDPLPSQRNDVVREYEVWDRLDAASLHSTFIQWTSSSFSSGAQVRFLSHLHWDPSRERERGHTYHIEPHCIAQSLHDNLIVDCWRKGLAQHLPSSRAWCTNGNAVDGNISRGFVGGM